MKITIDSDIKITGNTDKLIVLACLGSQPSFKAMDDPNVKGRGNYNDYRGVWEWDKENIKATDPMILLNIIELIEYYDKLEEAQRKQ